MLPTPNTTVLRDEARFGHLTQTNTRSRNAANAAALPASAEMIFDTAGAADSTGVTGFGIGTIGVGRGTLAFGAEMGGAAGRKLPWAAGALERMTGDVNARSVSAVTATWRTPCAWRFSKWRMVAS